MKLGDFKVSKISDCFYGIKELYWYPISEDNPIERHKILKLKTIRDKKIKNTEFDYKTYVKNKK